MNKRVATFDIETDGLLDDVTRIWCAVIKDHSDGRVIEFCPDNIGGLCDFLAKFDVLIGHNCITFDFPVLRKIYGWEYEGTKVDTLLMSRTQRPNRQVPKGCRTGPHSVEAWGMRLGIEKVANEVWSEWSEDILRRCKTDVEIQYKILDALLKEGKEEGWKNAHRLNFVLFDLLQRQEEYGWLVDKDTLVQNILALRRWIVRIDVAVGPHLPLRVDVLETKKDGEYNYVRKPFRKDGSYSEVVKRYYEAEDVRHDIRMVNGPFHRVSFRHVNLASIKETKEFLLTLGWVPKEWNVGPNGERTSPKFSKNDPFEGIQGSLGKLIAKRIQCRQRMSILEGWRGLIRPDGRVAPKISGVTPTGRLRHKDIVNIPSPHSGAFFAKQMREVFICKPGWVLVGVDSKGNQIRQLAARMGDPEFTEAVLHGKREDGTDLHSLNQLRSGAPSRSQAKNFFYGLIFGAGAPKIASTIGVDVAKARSLLSTYLKELPLLAELIEDLKKEWRETAQKWFNKKENRWVWYNGKIRGLDGRPIYADSEHKILNYALQSDEAIQLAIAYVMFHKWAERDGFRLGIDWGCLIWMHDEIQFESKPEIAERLASLGCEAIAWAGRYLHIPCKHEGEYKIGRNWYETH